MNKYVICIDTTNDQRKLLQLEHIYKVIDETEVDYVIDINGNDSGKKKTVPGSVKPLIRGMTDAALIQKKNEMFGLLCRLS